MPKKELKFFRILTSVRLAITLMLAIGVLCAAATLIPQGLQDADYILRYGRMGATLIALLGLDHAFTSPLMYGLGALFGVNLLCCTSLRLRWAAAVGRGRLAPWGSPILHLGLCIILVGVVFSAAGGRTLYYEIPVGETANINVGKQPFHLRVDDFEVEYYEDGTTPRQYRSQTWITDEDGSEQAASIEVNAPLKHRGVSIIQQSYGWHYGVSLHTGQVSRSLDFYREQWLTLGGEGSSQVTLGLAFYPDYMERDGIPASASDRANRPRLVWVLRQGETVVSRGVMAPGEQSDIQAPLSIRFDDYEYYTGLQAQYDPGIGIIFAGFFLVSIGLLIRYVFAMGNGSRKENKHVGSDAQP